jgi:hypothetical protein
MSFMAHLSMADSWYANIVENIYLKINNKNEIYRAGIVVAKTEDAYVLYAMKLVRHLTDWILPPFRLFL